MLSWMHCRGSPSKCPVWPVSSLVKWKAFRWPLTRYKETSLSSLPRAHYTLKHLWLYPFKIFQNVSKKHTPYGDSGPSNNDVCRILHRLLVSAVCSESSPPFSSSPSAMCSSKNWFTPPVTRFRTKVNMSGLKYVCFERQITYLQLNPTH